MASFVCEVCGFIYDDDRESETFESLSANWTCPVCGSKKEVYTLTDDAEISPNGSVSEQSASDRSESSVQVERDKYLRSEDDFESTMADIHNMASNGERIIEPMRTQAPTFTWGEILIKGAQLSRMPLNDTDPVSLKTTIGPKARYPLVIDFPVFVTHMSYGALSKEAKVALSRGTAIVKTATCSGEGGILPESLEASYRFIFEYVPNQYSVTDEYLKRVDAVEIKIGQSAKPGMGGHLPGNKVTPEIAAIRGFDVGHDIISPAHHADITDEVELSEKIAELRERSGGKPIGVKLAAGHIEDDINFALKGNPDFITVDGRAGATGAAPKYVKQATSIPSIFALFRARRAIDSAGADGVSLIITGGLRVSPDFAKALAMGADAIAIGTAALMAIGCQQYRMCHTGKCPMGITTHDPVLRANFDVDSASDALARFLTVSAEELADFARLTGHDDVHGLELSDLATTNSEVSTHTEIEHV